MYLNLRSLQELFCVLLVSNAGVVMRVTSKKYIALLLWQLGNSSDLL